MMSEMPRRAAASRNSFSRTRPRSPSATSAGSLIVPRSPREAQSSTIRAPASESLANVPPQVSVSSSGWAKMPTIVRPASGRSATWMFEQALVHSDVFVHHAGRAEPRDRALADAPAIQRENARQAVDEFLDVVENAAGHAVVHH